MTLNDSPKEAWQLCFRILPRVSRTFALSIAGLREPLKGAVCVAYLQCRILDTIEDAPGLTAGERWKLIAPFLEAIRSGIPPGVSWLKRIEEKLAERSMAADMELMRNAADVLRCFNDCEESARLSIARWVTEMGKGMTTWSERMGREPSKLKTLPSMAALDRYCYYIAGTVGYMLTDLFFIYSPLVDRALFYRLQSDAEVFGLGLQKVNIIKDLADDYRRGWCFLPMGDLAAQGLTPAALVRRSEADGVYRAALPTLASTTGHLQRAWSYLERFPIEERETRIFLAYSLFFALKTLALVAKRPSRLVDEAKLKISRMEVVKVMGALQRKIDHPSALEAYYAECFAPLARFPKDLELLQDS